MILTSIRTNFFALFALLAVVLFGAVGLHIQQLRDTYFEAEAQIEANEVRDRIVRTFIAVADERHDIYISKLKGSVADSRLAIRTDRLLKNAVTTLSISSYLDIPSEVSELEEIGATLHNIRELSVPAPQPLNDLDRITEADAAFSAYSTILDRLRLVRIRLLTHQGDNDTSLTLIFHLRTYGLSILDELMRNATLAERALVLADPMATDALAVPALDFFRDQIVLLRNVNTRFAIPSAALDETIYRTARNTLRNALTSSISNTSHPSEVVKGLVLPVELNGPTSTWRSASSQAISSVVALQNELFIKSRTRLDDRLDLAGRKTLLWMLMLAFSFMGVVATGRVVITHVVRPLDNMRGAMLRLADGDMTISLAKGRSLSEIGAMEDALRVFKANALRQQRLQEERLDLHRRLENAYRSLRTDLEAAAAIQSSLLPQASRMGGITMSSYFRPSHFLAGDSFDVIQPPDGRITLFQIDVAGHGAAAALVSVTAHYTIAQAMLQREPTSGLASLVEEINAQWPNDLPYFTMVLVEIDQRAGRGRLVQAGHPSPWLMDRRGTIVELGNGGLPIGVTAHADYEEVDFRFGPGDRLFVMTDGAHETQNVEGDVYSEERMGDLLRASALIPTEEIISCLDQSLRDWRGNMPLDDDVTIVVLEGDIAHEHHAEPTQRTDSTDDRRYAA